MLGSDLFSHASVGHYMAQYALHTSENATSVELETDRVLSTVQKRNAPGINAETERPVEQSSFHSNTSLQDRLSNVQQNAGPDGKEFTPEEEKEIERLKQRDAEVKRHEQAHVQAGGRYASAPKYEYETGPDGKRYAVGGSVNIDTSAVPDDPEATLEKARVIKRAALAPEEPSAQDRKVAREADYMAAMAQRQIQEERSASVKVAVDNSAAAIGSGATQEAELPIDGIAQVATKSLEIERNQSFTSSMVTQFKLSQLQMGNSHAFRMATLSSSGNVSFRHQGLSFDRLA